ncbi:DNA-binding protein [Rhodococcus sp. ABRD24]|uniref:helix-turn-helix transcriptional regulator n=1 Tax=Rhodococcus sp. ABRD24 TaxID=2507582 RepID=UPI00103B7786|nr:helix-turn-helix domain-containing protein [Rhodococcus sp. ABRD24]QBJ94983.1 DNA-binding protein [Rhodococcus sp. ABRD24]
MQTSEDYWLSREEVAGRIKLPVKTLAQWASQGKGPRFSKIGRFARYKMSDLIAWEDAQATRGGGD